MAHNARFVALLKEMRELHDRKNADYAMPGDPLSNFRQAGVLVDTFREAGAEGIDLVFAALVGIKLARLAQLSRRAPLNESRQDTQRDLAVYAALWATSVQEGAQAEEQLEFRWDQAFTVDAGEARA